MIFSVIITTYNREKEIYACIKSVLNQTFKDFELIIIDNGSTDNTKAIIQKFLQQDARIKYFWQKNSGTAAGGRNTGILKSSGTYIAFLDSDDTFNSNMLEEMYLSAIKYNSDIVVCNFNRVNHKNEIIKKSNYNQENINFKGQLSLKINPATWNKIYKRSLFIDNKITFKNHIFCEDLATIIEPFYFAKRISYCPKNLYNYLINPNGDSFTINEKFIHNIFIALEHNKKFLRKYNIQQKYQQYFIERFIHQIKFIMSEINKSPSLKLLSSLNNILEKFNLIEKKIHSNSLSKDNYIFLFNAYNCGLNLKFILSEEDIEIFKLLNSHAYKLDNIININECIQNFTSYKNLPNIVLEVNKQLLLEYKNNPSEYVKILKKYLTPFSKTILIGFGSFGQKISNTIDIQFIIDKDSNKDDNLKYLKRIEELPDNNYIFINSILSIEDHLNMNEGIKSRFPQSKLITLYINFAEKPIQEKNYET